MLVPPASPKILVIFSKNLFNTKTSGNICDAGRLGVKLSPNGIYGNFGLKFLFLVAAISTSKHHKYYLFGSQRISVSNILLQLLEFQLSVLLLLCYLVVQL